MAVNPYETASGRRHALLDMTRRQFFGLMAGAAALVAALFGGLKSLGFLFPNSTLEDPLQFTVDADPATISVGNPLQITAKRVSVVRDDAGFYAVYLICTHLGCTPNYVSNVTNGTGVIDDVAKKRGERKPEEQQPNGWACPCHGSRYFIDSTNFYGPAPRPMDWVDVSFSPSGKLIVDRGKLVVSRTAGATTAPEWRLDPNTKQNNGKTLGV